MNRKEAEDRAIEEYLNKTRNKGSEDNESNFRRNVATYFKADFAYSFLIRFKSMKKDNKNDNTVHVELSGPAISINSREMNLLLAQVKDAYGKNYNNLVINYFNFL